VDPEGEDESGGLLSFASRGRKGGHLEKEGITLCITKVLRSIEVARERTLKLDNHRRAVKAEPASFGEKC